MKLIVKAVAMNGGEVFDGLDDDSRFTDYVDSNFPLCVTGGYMEMVYNKVEDILYTVTTYNTTRKLTPEEEEIVIDYTQGQWSDGIGEDFEQQVFEDAPEGDTPVYYPSPWHFGQVAHITYE